MFIGKIVIQHNIVKMQFQLNKIFAKKRAHNKQENKNDKKTKNK